MKKYLNVINYLYIYVSGQNEDLVHDLYITELYCL